MELTININENEKEFLKAKGELDLLRQHLSVPGGILIKLRRALITKEKEI